MDSGILGQQIFYGLSNGMAYVLFSVGLTIIFGILGIINVAHGEFYMLGAMIFSWLISSFGFNIIVAAVIAIAIGAGIGVVTNRAVVQPIHGKQGFVLATFLATLGIGILLWNLATYIWGSQSIIVNNPFNWTVMVNGINLTGERIMLFVIGGGILAVLMLWLSRSMIGKQLQAVAQDPIGAKLVGINLEKVYTIGFIIATSLAVISGILITPIWNAFPSMGQQILVKGFVVCIVAGMGSIRGSIIIGLLLGFVEAVFGQYVSIPYREAIGYVIMIVVLLVKPQGLFSRRNIYETSQ